jgi:SAM-dependent methyltransferase
VSHLNFDASQVTEEISDRVYLLAAGRKPVIMGHDTAQPLPNALLRVQFRRIGRLGLQQEPAVRFPHDGFDYHTPSIDTATQRAVDGGVADRVTFAQATAKDYPGRDYDLICFFDCLHDMGDPVGAARHAYQALKPDGTVLLVEPFAGDRLEENSNPVGRLFYAASTCICTPNSLSQEVGLGLGAQAGEARLREVFREAGFTRVRRATATPFNLILEARK